MASSRVVLALLVAAALMGGAREAQAGCCTGPNTCVDLDEVACEAAGGFWTPVECADSPCGSGACCLRDGTCMNGTTEPECRAMEGFFAGVAVDCGSLTCGACLFSDGTCLPIPQELCGIASVASYGGIFTPQACDDVEPVELACCLLDGTCIDTSLIDCVRSDQEFVEPGFPDVYLSMCDPCVGACCAPAGCVEVSESECDAQGGVWLGPNTDCATHAPDGPCYAELQHVFFTGSIPNGVENLAVDLFDPSDPDCNCNGCTCERELIGVTAILDQTVTGFFEAENNDPQNVLLGLTYQVSSQIDFPFGNEIIDADSEIRWLRSRSASLSDGHPQMGPDFVVFGDFVFSASDLHPDPPDPPDGFLADNFDVDTGFLDSAPIITQFTGPGQVDARVELSNSVQLDGSNDFLLLGRHLSVKVSLRVIYFYRPLGNIAGRVWEDENCDGCDNFNEPGIADVEVELLDEFGNTVNLPGVTNPVFTNGLGEYCFSNLPDGVYQVLIDRGLSGLDDFVFTLPNSDNCPDGPDSDSMTDSDFIPEEPRAEIGVTELIEIVDGTCEEFVDAGFIEPEYRIYGALYIDTDGDGCGDDPIAGVEVQLIPPAGPSLFDTTDANGMYAFEALDNGLHTIDVDLTQPELADLDIVLLNCADPDFDNDLSSSGQCSFDLQFTEDDRDNDCLVERQCNGVFGEFERPEFCGCEGKGSVLYFHKIEIRWDASGEPIQDTWLELSNDWPTDVDVLMYFINGDPPLEETNEERAHPGWNWLDNKILLTGNQPIYWSALNGAGSIESLSPFTVLDPSGPGELPGRPAVDGTTDRVLRGYIVAFAVNEGCEEIRWNHLSGKGTLVHVRDHISWEYNACAFPAIVDDATGLPAHGDQTGSPGIINLDGIEFQAPPAMLLLQFQATGSAAWSIPDRMVISDTDVTLHPASVDLRLDVGSEPVATKAEYIVFNENENKLSGSLRCVVCWDQALLSMYGIPNNFSVAALGTDHGYARIDGIESVQCENSQHAAILGVSARYLLFDGNLAGAEASSQELVGCECEAAVIQYDTMDVPPPEQPFEPRRYRTADEFVDALNERFD